jgi:hypothetical protein
MPPFNDHYPLKLAIAERNELIANENLLRWKMPG